MSRGVGEPLVSETGAACARVLSRRDRLKPVLDELAGKRVLLLGLGLFGGGEGAARFLAQRGARLTVSDLKTAERLAPVLERLSGFPIDYRLGPRSQSAGPGGLGSLRPDLVVVNPAIPRDAPIVRLWQQRGVILTSPMNVFLTLCRARVAAVTGSMGKSTTATMLGAMLQRTSRRTWLGGNIGVSLLPAVDEIAPDDVVVLEMSSFQLEDSGCLPWSPHLAVVTNITPNHLDRHGSFEAYVAAKRNIVAFQSEGDWAVLNASDPIQQGWLEGGERLSPSVLMAPFGQGRGGGAEAVPAGRGGRGQGPGVVFFDPTGSAGSLVAGMSLRNAQLLWRSRGGPEQVVCAAGQVALPGSHNMANALAAAAAARCLGVECRRVREALEDFEGLEHRLEQCGGIGGITFYNDSKATTPESTIAALKTLGCPVTLIAGGRNKGLSLGAMAEVIARRASVLVTLGEAGPDVARLTREASSGLRGSGAPGEGPALVEAASLEEAVEAALRLSMPGWAVVFSPGCASYDMFENYSQRGRRFKELVATAQAGAGA